MSSPAGGVRISLAWKTVLAFSAVVLAAVLAVSLLSGQAAAREVRVFMFGGAMTDAPSLAGELAAYYREQGSWQGVEALFAGRLPAHMGGQGALGMMRRMTAGLTLADPGGRVLASNLARAPARLPAARAAEALPIVVDGRTVGLLLVESAPAGAAESADLVARVLRSTWLVTLLVGGVALLVGGALVAGLLRPVRELTAAAQGLARGERSRRVAVRSSDELGALAQAFNQMADSLERNERLRRDMTADVAHELRNPLAVMQAQVEAILDGVHPPTPENLRTVLDQTQLLNRLVEDLRTLALADAEQLGLQRAPLELAALLRRQAEAHRPQAETAGVALELEPGPPIPPAWADESRIAMVVGNLLSNALRHTPAGGRVALGWGAAPDGRTVWLRVTDTGEGLPPDDLELVFERFYRGDRGRARAEGGTGLGLAIARKLVEAHGGTIGAAARPGGGAAFTVTLPAAAPG